LIKGVFVVGLAVGTLMIAYGWFDDCVILQFMERPPLPPSCFHSNDGEWTAIFGVIIVIVSAIELIQSFLKPKTTGSETPEENTT
jgi:hypothetical protein